ncbi:alpha/beta hydrolase [Nonomuraea sp. NPDC050404]|uniref:alpha/beta fold hydrolase n=1 Tax=Nonomuraea sp. NPDC050404 TaxID=3155783 RepID=UPI0033F001C2
MSEEKALNVGPCKIEMAYERFGDPEAPPVLLVMGGGGQLIHWPEGFCAELVARGCHVIRFDNRDAGLSTHFHDAPPPDLRAAMAGDTSSASYTLSDMASDTVGLLDVLGLDSVHCIGASMGGMIAQLLAIEHPSRVRSLTSMMSTTGAPDVGRPDPAALSLVTEPPPTTNREHATERVAGSSPTDREEVIERWVRAFQVVGSPGYPVEEAEIRENARIAYDRAYDPVGASRQGVAALASGDRTAGLRSITVPTLVIHGADDPICDRSGGEATAEVIPGAELVIIDGMGHNLPRGLWPQLASLIATFVQRTESAMVTGRSHPR